MTTVAPPRTATDPEPPPYDDYEPTGRGLDRLPPQDLDAERSVLGAMMLSKDAIADVVELLKGRDFYRPAHELVYTAILDLYGKGEPADPITVTAELTKRGEIGRVGGAAAVHAFVQAVPTAANADYIAAMPPGIGAALADWLGAAADMAKAYPEMAHDHDRPACDDYACDLMSRAITLARQILA